MIGKPEIMQLAAQTRLAPHVVEKDYVLGWILAGIYAHPKINQSWVFKGGTCLKKCYFETYRFSEDLDFTLTDETHLHQEFLGPVFIEIAEWIYERTGLAIPHERIDFEILKNPRGHLSCQGKISYQGPVSPNVGPQRLPRIKLDLTADERLVLAPVQRRIFHPYSDEPDGGIKVLTYAYEEAFGEKVRALAERTRPRDLYDVINLFRNEESRPSPSVLLDVLRQKCEFKGIALPRAVDLEPHRGDLEGAWEHMLGHQLPALPPVASFWEALPEFFSWLEGAITPAAPPSYTLGSGERVIRERTIRMPVGGYGQSALEIIRFAAANRLCVDLDYQGSTRRIEPYSLRETQEGNIVLHAWNTDKGAHRSYRLDRIEGALATNETFTPRYAVELSPTGSMYIPPTSRTGDSGSGFSSFPSLAPRRAARTRATPLSSGPTYVYQCGMCGKKFQRKSQSSRLNQHKTPSGWDCPGRIGMLVHTKY
jgi:predicted nucleotidyltransferase component of viral defense system